jgi:hypothetical protein
MASAIRFIVILDAILIQLQSPFRDHQFHFSRRHTNLRDWAPCRGTDQGNDTNHSG